MFGTIFVAQERYVSQFLFFDVKRVYSRFDENGIELIFIMKTLGFCTAKRCCVFL